MTEQRQNVEDPSRKPCGMEAIWPMPRPQPDTLGEKTLYDAASILDAYRGMDWGKVISAMYKLDNAQLSSSVAALIDVRFAPLIAAAEAAEKRLAYLEVDVWDGRLGCEVSLDRLIDEGGCAELVALRAAIATAKGGAK